MGIGVWVWVLRKSFTTARASGIGSLGGAYNCGTLCLATPPPPHRACTEGAGLGKRGRGRGRPCQIVTYDKLYNFTTEDGGLLGQISEIEGGVAELWGGGGGQGFF